MISMIPRHDILVYILYDEMSWGHDDGYVVLHTPMEGLVIDAIYWETMIHSTEAVLRDVSSRRVVGMSSWYITHGWHTRVNTSVGTVYDIFWFSWYKIYMYYILQIYMYYKRNTSGLWLCPSPTIFKEGFWSLMSFKEKLNL